MGAPLKCGTLQEKECWQQIAVRLLSFSAEEIEIVKRETTFATIIRGSDSAARFRSPPQQLWCLLLDVYWMFPPEIGHIQWKVWNLEKVWKFRLTSRINELGQLVENIAGA